MRIWMHFWMGFGEDLAKQLLINSDPGCPRRNARGAWILNMPRISPHSSSHALLPQRGAADSNAPRIPPGQT